MKIPLRGRYGKGLFAEVDDCDAHLVERRWFVVKDEHRMYANTGFDGRSVGIHRFVLGDKPGMVIDHIDGDGLNNKRANLRHVSRSQNAANARLSKRSKTGVKGVYVERINGCEMLRACVAFDGVRHRKYFNINDIAGAASWVAETREKVHGAFSNHGHARKP